MLVVATREHHAEHVREWRFTLAIDALLVDQDWRAGGAIAEPVTVAAHAVLAKLPTVREVRVVQPRHARLRQHAHGEVVLHFGRLHASVTRERRQRLHRVIADGREAHGVLRKAVQLEGAARHRLRHVRLRKPARARVLELRITISVVRQLVAPNVRAANAVQLAQAERRLQTAPIIRVVRQHPAAANDVGVPVRVLLGNHGGRLRRVDTRVHHRIRELVHRHVLTGDLVAQLPGIAGIPGLRVVEAARPTVQFHRPARVLTRILRRQGHHTV